MTVRRVVLSSLVAAISVWAASLVYPSYLDYKKTQRQLYELDQKLLQQQRKNEELLEKAHDLKTNPKSVERVARDKFGWSRPGEKVYDFSN